MEECAILSLTEECSSQIGRCGAIRTSKQSQWSPTLPEAQQDGRKAWQARRDTQGRMSLDQEIRCIEKSKLEVLRWETKEQTRNFYTCPGSGILISYGKK